MKMNSIGLSRLALAFAFLGAGFVQAQDVERGPREILVHLPNPHQGGPFAGAAGRPGPAKSNGIDYHGGPVMLGTVNAYVIWYGTWSFDGAPATATTIISDFLNSIGGSPYFDINTTYHNGNGFFVSGQVQGTEQFE
jgi:hypothetical protein